MTNPSRRRLIHRQSLEVVLALVISTVALVRDQIEQDDMAARLSPKSVDVTFNQAYRGLRAVAALAELLSRNPPILEEER